MLKKFFLALALSLLIVPGARAAGTQAWIGGNGQGIGSWATLCGASGADLNSLAAGSSQLCTTTVTNTTALDVFISISGSFTTTSTAFTAGQFIGIAVWPLNQDGTTYGTNEIPTPGTAVTHEIGGGFQCTMLAPLITTTNFTGYCGPIVIPPGTFKVVVYNGLTPGLSASAQALQYESYNFNLNR